MVAFAPGAVLTAANLNTAFNALTIRTVTGVSDTLVLADNGGAVTYSNAAATTSTIPPNASVAFAVGTKIVLINLGAGVVTVTAGAGVTVNGATLTLAQNSGGTCIKTATNTWSFLPFSSGVGNAVFSGAATGTYTGFAYKTFVSSGTLTVTTAGFADILIGAGGGGCGGDTGANAINAGGGGGGGIFGGGVTTVFLPVGTHTVTVGAGGARWTQQGGGPSRIAFMAAVGGGLGWGYSTLTSYVNGAFGGCGGGGSNISTTAQPGGTAMASQGFNGGTGSSTQNATGGGGGGGGGSSVGAVGTTSVGGAGGAGYATTFVGTTPSGAYVAGTFTCSGGGGGARGSGSPGAGGAGGGGAGSTGGVGTDGTVNTGGGGGGGFQSTALQPSQGGSGIVIVRVAV
jgi:hypothetical protein